MPSNKPKPSKVNVAGKIGAALGGLGPKFPAPGAAGAAIGAIWAPKKP